LDKTIQRNPHFVWCFLEIFSREGGIQSYIKDIFVAYNHLESDDRPPTSDVLLLRDAAESDNPFESESLNFHYFRSPSPPIGRIRLAVALLGLLISKRPARVFCGHINLSCLTQVLCKPLGIPYTVLTYGKEVWYPLPPKYRKALQQADEIWTISRYSRDRACESNDLDPDRFQMVPCMVDGDRFTPGPKPGHLVDRYDLSDSKVLMTVARLWSGDIYKGVDVTIRALPDIAQIIPNVKYLVIGRGDDQPRLARLAEDLGVSDRVIFAGFVPSEDLPDHYRVADAYIMPSLEGFGIVYLEAMAGGIPVLSGDDDGSADPLQDGRLGWQVPHRDPEAVARACIEILKGEDQRCQGDWLREQSLAIFGKAAFQQRIHDLLDQSVV